MDIEPQFLNQSYQQQTGEDKHKLLEAIIGMSPDVIYLYHAQQQKFLFFNREMASLLGYTTAEMQAYGPDLLLQGIHPEDLARVGQHIQTLAKTSSDEIFDLEYRAKKKDGHYIWLYIRERVYQRDIHNQPEILFGICQDITRRKAAEERNQYLARLYATLSQVNQTIVRKTDRPSLFEAICKVAIDFGGFQLAWIGLLGNQPGEVIPLAVHGKDGVKFPFATINIQTESFKSGLIAQAIQSAQVQSSPDIQTDPRMVHWREAAARDHYHSAAAVPLRQNGQVVGVLNLYAAEEDFFASEEEQSLLAEMGLDISFALDNVQHEIERMQAVERWEFALEGAGDGVWDWNIQSNEVFYSRQWKAMLGYSEEEIGNSLDEWDKRVNPDDKADCYAAIEEHFRGRTLIYKNEHRVQCKDGTYKWILDRGKIVEWTSSGAPRRMIGIHSDITERKQTEEVLRESEAALKASQRVAHVGHWTWDTVTNRVAWSEEMYHIFGLDPARFDGDLAHVVEEAIHPEDREKVNATNQAVLTEQKPTPLEYRVIWPDGSVHTVWGEAGDKIVDETGKILKLSGIVQDITERKQKEKDIRQWADAFMHCSHGIAIGIPNNNLILTCNPAFARAQGRSIAEIVNTPILSMYTPESYSTVHQAIMEADRTGRVQYLAQMRRKDGSTYPVQMDVVSVRDERGTLLYRVATQEDITERLRSEAQIKNSLAEKETLLRELYHRTKNNMAVIIALLDLQSATFEDDRLLQAFLEAKNRVRSMALVHQKLYDAQDLSRINLKEYITDLVQLLMRTYSVSASKISVVSEMEDVFVLIDSAIPCGLIINELVSNSLKYAFPAGATGEITIGLQRAANNEICLVIADNGIGMSPQFNFRRDGHLGLQTVFSLAEKQLHGRVDFSATSGVSFQLTFQDIYYQVRI